MKSNALLRLLTSRQRKLCLTLSEMLLPHTPNHSGRPRHHGLLPHVVVFVAKARLNLPYRILEQITEVCHVTLMRMVHRVTKLLGELSFAVAGRCSIQAVDTTLIRIGRQATYDDYTGYKHFKGIKFQVTVDLKGQVTTVSKAYPASWHDKRIYIHERVGLPEGTTVLGDKAYVGLRHCGVIAPEKKNHTAYKKRPAEVTTYNRMLSCARIVVEHVFASIKCYRLFYYACYFSKKFLNYFFTALCHLHNIEKNATL